MRGVGLGGQGGCERRIEVFVKIPPPKKKNRGGGVASGGGGGELGAQGGCERRIEVIVKMPKKNSRGSGPAGDGGGGLEGWRLVEGRGLVGNNVGGRGGVGYGGWGVWTKNRSNSTMYKKVLYNIKKIKKCGGG